MPASLHLLLKSAAQAEGMSLNQYCLYILARHVPDSQSWMRKKGEDLLTFLVEAQIFQKELKKEEKISGAMQPQETPRQRWKKIYGTV